MCVLDHTGQTGLDLDIKLSLDCTPLHFLPHAGIKEDVNTASLTKSGLQFCSKITFLCSSVIMIYSGLLLVSRDCDQN